MMNMTNLKFSESTTIWQVLRAPPETRSAIPSSTAQEKLSGLSGHKDTQRMKTNGLLGIRGACTHSQCKPVMSDEVIHPSPDTVQLSHQGLLSRVVCKLLMLTRPRKQEHCMPPQAASAVNRHDTLKPPMTIIGGWLGWTVIPMKTGTVTCSVNKLK